MSAIPRLPFKAMEALLFSLGFIIVRQIGGQVLYRHPDGRTTTLPLYATPTLARPLVREILRDISLTPEQFREQAEQLCERIFSGPRLSAC